MGHVRRFINALGVALAGCLIGLSSLRACLNDRCLKQSLFVFLNVPFIPLCPSLVVVRRLVTYVAAAPCVPRALGRSKLMHGNPRTTKWDTAVLTMSGRFQARPLLGSGSKGVP